MQKARSGIAVRAFSFASRKNEEAGSRIESGMTIVG
jgi:hypothetical protein